MSVATLRYEPAPKAEPAATLQRGRGVAELAFRRDGATTKLAHLFQQTPCRVLFPLPEIGDPALAVLVTTSGGLTGGDEIRLEARIMPAAHATLTTQAAEKLYRSLGPDVQVDHRFTIEDGAYFEYLPQETILFDGARLSRRNHATVAAAGRFLACEMIVFGRAARGEQVTRGRVHDSWRIWRDGRLVWADALALGADIAAQLAAPLGFGGATALATALYAGDDAEGLLPLARKLAQASAGHGGATIVNGLLLARFFGAPAAEVRADLARFTRGLRAAGGWPARLPRVWNI